MPHVWAEARTSRVAVRSVPTDQDLFLRQCSLKRAPAGRAAAHTPTRVPSSPRERRSPLERTRHLTNASHGRRDLRPSRPEHAPDRQQISSLGTPRAENATMPPKKIAPYLVFAGDMRDKCRAELVAAGNPNPRWATSPNASEKSGKSSTRRPSRCAPPAPPASAPSRSNRAPPRASSREWKRSSHPSPSISPQAYKDRAEATNAEAAREYAEKVEAGEIDEAAEEDGDAAPDTSLSLLAFPRSRQAHHEAR